ncbi:unnamed protein product [Rotaria sp. Silwood1]|nr:unnamed protein product [Rotaria sp. Silwood1]
MTKIYSEYPKQLQSDQFFSLINTAVASNNIDDEEIAQQYQEQLFYDTISRTTEPSSEVMTSIDMRPLEELDADAAYALQLQEEEYSKNSITPFLSYQQNLNDRAASNAIVNFGNDIIAGDAELAAQLQADENKKQQQQKDNQRRIPYSTINRNPQSNASGSVTNPPFFNPTNQLPSFSGNNNHVNNNFVSLLRAFTSRGQSFRGSHRFRGHGNRNIENTEEDFGPDDYENLLELDASVNKQALSNDQINTLPTEKFRHSANTTAEENQCSICWDNFEPNQTLRRLPCLHRYHQSCIDNWLKTSSLCPVCRTPSNQ